jgi:NADPH:quinone reductase-like Zn-dependent oxidoreductase
MKAIRIHDYGDADQLRYEDAPVPDIAPDEVLIRIHAAGVNPADWRWREGLMRQVRPLHFPAILGAAAAGTLEKVGAAVARFKPAMRWWHASTVPTPSSPRSRPMRSAARPKAFR